MYAIYSNNNIASICIWIKSMNNINRDAIPSTTLTSSALSLSLESAEKERNTPVHRENRAPSMQIMYLNDYNRINLFMRISIFEWCMRMCLCSNESFGIFAFEFFSTRSIQSRWKCYKQMRGDSSHSILSSLFSACSFQKPYRETHPIRVSAIKENQIKISRESASAAEKSPSRPRVVMLQQRAEKEKMKETNW